MGVHSERNSLAKMHRVHGITCLKYDLPDVQIIICLDDESRVVGSLNILQEGVHLHWPSSQLP